MQVPDDLVEVGHVSGAYGIRELDTGFGLIPLTHRRCWRSGSGGWICRSGARSGSHAGKMTVQGDEIVARLANMTDRNAAEALRGCGDSYFKALFSCIGRKRVLLGRSDRSGCFQPA